MSFSPGCQQQGLCSQTDPAGFSRKRSWWDKLESECEGSQDRELMLIVAVSSCHLPKNLISLLISRSCSSRSTPSVSRTAICGCDGLWLSVRADVDVNALLPSWHPAADSTL